MRIHPVFHISLLEPADPDTPIGPAPEIYPDLQEEVYTVEKVLKVRRHRKTLQWLVKWEGYGNEHNTWESKENLIDCREALREFYQENLIAQNQEKRRIEARRGLESPRALREPPMISHPSPK
jgi:hypothetical protein